MTRYRFLYVFLVCLLLSSALFCQEAGDDIPLPDDETALVFPDMPEPVDPVNRSSVWSYLSVVFVLVLVVAAIYMLFHFLKKAGGSAFRENNEIRIVSTRSISGTKQLHIIEIGNEFSLIGAGENGITLLKEIHDAETIDRLRLAASQSPRQPEKTFADLLAAFIPGMRNKEQNGTNKSNNSSNTADISKTFLKTQQDRLKKL